MVEAFNIENEGGKKPKVIIFTKHIKPAGSGVYEGGKLKIPDYKINRANGNLEAINSNNSIFKLMDKIQAKSKPVINEGGGGGGGGGEAAAVSAEELAKKQAAMEGAVAALEEAKSALEAAKLVVVGIEEESTEPAARLERVKVAAEADGSGEDKRAALTEIENRVAAIDTRKAAAELKVKEKQAIVDAATAKVKELE